MPTTFDGFARHLPTKKKSNAHHLPTHFFRFLVRASYGFARANPHKIFSLALKGQATGTACSSLKFHFCLLGIPKTFCVVALEMKNKRAARNRAHLHIMFMMRAKIENPWHKNLADRTDGPNFFRPLKAKFADAKMKKTKKKSNQLRLLFCMEKIGYFV